MLQDQVVIITGASEGIGRATAIAFAGQGARLVLAARRPEALRATGDEISGLGGRAVTMVTDVTDSWQFERLAERTLETFGAIDILVNNVGRGLCKPFIELTDPEWARLVAENLSSTVYGCRAVLPAMRRQRHGLIINIASRAGRIGEAGFAAYCAVKHGVVGLTKALAIEEEPNGIRVNAICPGSVATERMKRALPHVDKSRWLTPDQVAEAVLFLATSPARTMQGRTLDLF